MRIESKISDVRVDINVSEDSGAVTTETAIPTKRIAANTNLKDAIGDKSDQQIKELGGCGFGGI